MISKLTKEEVQEVIQLGTMLNPNFSKLFHIENLNPNETIYIYKENNINKGFIHIQNGLDIIDLLNIIVKPEYQNQGIGSVLLKYIIDNRFYLISILLGFIIYCRFIDASRKSKWKIKYLKIYHLSL